MKICFLFFSIIASTYCFALGKIPIVSSAFVTDHYVDSSEMSGSVLNHTQYMKKEMEAYFDSSGIFQDWTLRTISLGLAVKMEIGIGDLTAGITPKVRTIFIKKGLKPIWP